MEDIKHLISSNYKKIKKFIILNIISDEVYYDKVYRETEEYHISYKESNYFPLWKKIQTYIRQDWKILELGCGSGQLAHYLYDCGITTYKGIDISAKAIEFARKKNLNGFDFFKQDIYKTTLFSEFDYDAIIATEVLEHLKDDLFVLRNLQKGKIIIASLPTFDYKSHYRYFENKKSVIDRYEIYLSDIDVKKEGRYFIMIGKK